MNLVKKVKQQKRELQSRRYALSQSVQASYGDVDTGSLLWGVAIAAFVSGALLQRLSPSSRHLPRRAMHLAFPFLNPLRWF